MKCPAYSVIINIELLIKVREFCIIISTFGFCSFIQAICKLPGITNSYLYLNQNKSRAV